MLKLDFKQKYFKYKYKYLYIKSQIGGSESILWYVEDQDRKFSLLNIYEAEQQNKIRDIYVSWLWLDGEKICKKIKYIDKRQEKEKEICIEKKDDNVSLNFMENKYSAGKMIPIEKKIRFIDFNYVNFNQGIKICKLPNCMRFIEDYLYNFFDLSDIDLISIGSGNGLFEKCSEDVFGKKIICIDPEPTSFASSGLDDKPFIKPDFNTVNDYLLSATKKDKSILFLIWPDPSLDYDIEAIFKLKPISFFIIYGDFPLAGSEYLRGLLYSKEKDIILRYNDEQEEYEKLATTEVVGSMDLEIKMSINIRMSVFIKKIISNDILELKQNQYEINIKYSYFKKPLISKLSLNTVPINERFSVGDIKLS